MLAHRLLQIVLVALAVCFLWSDEVGALEDAAWQPYRDIYQPKVTPTQHLVDAPENVCPPDVAVEGQIYCPQPAYVQSHQPLYFNPPMAVPLVVPVAGQEVRTWHVLPENLIWQSYWAGAKEARMSGAAFQDTASNMSLLDVSLGGRSALLRYGTNNPNSASRPLGWELQIEGAGMVRLNLDENWDMESGDFRFGVPIVYGREEVQFKFSYYHLSSHIGDEFLVRNPGFTRINFSRDVLVAAISFFPRPAWRWYAEMGWAFYADEGTEPWEFQFGVDYAQPGPTGCYGTPFFAINGHLRQEVDFGGNLSTQAGWLWRGDTGHVFRTGLHYFNGKSNQFEFYDQFEQQIGLGLWYDY